MQFSQQLVSQCRCETSCWRIAQCNMGCLAIFSLREALHEVELRSTFRNGLQQLTTPLHSVSPLQQLVSQFYSRFMAVLTRAHAHTYYISFRRALRDKLLRKLHSVTGPQHQTSATCNATFSTVARQVAEKIAQCNRTLKEHDEASKGVALTLDRKQQNPTLKDYMSSHREFWIG